MASGLSLLVVLLLCSVSSEAQLRVYQLFASDLPSDAFGITDAYVNVFIGSTQVGRTSVAHNMVNPWWDEEFHHLQAKQNDILRLEVYDEDLFVDDLLGICQRQIQVGTHRIDCFLKEGVFHYSYTLS